MIEITAFGLLADHAESSIGFYRNTLGLERVLPIKNYGNQTLLRIESPPSDLITQRG